MASVTVCKELQFSISNEAFDEIAESAAAIAVWPEDFSIELDDDDETVLAKIDQGDDSYVINAQRVEDAAIRVISQACNTGFSADARLDLIECIEDGEIEAIDAETADQLVQVTCFGEVIYA
jgi:hypothetical protein